VNGDSGSYKDLVIKNLSSKASGNAPADFTINPDQNNPNLIINIWAKLIWDPTKKFPTVMRFDAADTGDDTSGNGAINLKDYVESGNNVPQLKFQFSGGTDTVGNYHINGFYLTRLSTMVNGKDTVNASDIGTITPLPLEECSTPPNSQTTCLLNPTNPSLKAEPDSSNNITLTPNSDQQKDYEIQATIGLATPTPYQIYNGSDISNSILQTFANTKGGVQRLITNDTITTTDPLIKGTSSGKTIATFNGSSVIISTEDPNKFDLDNDPGKYPSDVNSSPKLINATSTSGGSNLSADLNKYFNVTLYTLPYIKQTTDSFDMRFSAYQPTDTDNSGVRPLSKYIYSSNWVQDLKFKYANNTTQNAEFSLIQDGNNWYLGRTIFTDWFPQYLNAQDVNSTNRLQTISVCSGNNCASGPINLTVTKVLGDTAVDFRWTGNPEWIIPFQNTSGNLYTKQCYYPLWNSNSNPNDSSANNLGTFIHGMRVKDAYRMACSPGGGLPTNGNNTDLGYLNNIGGNRTIGYMGGDRQLVTTPYCDLDTLVSMPNNLSTDFTVTTYDKIGIHFFQSQAYDGFLNYITNGSDARSTPVYQIPGLSIVFDPTKTDCNP
jgi:hypothetical protein